MRLFTKAVNISAFFLIFYHLTGKELVGADTAEVEEDVLTLEHLAKVESGLFSEEEVQDEKRDVIVTFGTMQELKEISLQIQSKYESSSKEERIYAMYEAMHGYSSKCQEPAKSYLESGEYNYHGMWSTNLMIIRDADKACVHKLAKMKDVAFIGKDKALPLTDPVKTTVIQFERGSETEGFCCGDDDGDENRLNTAPGKFSTRMSWGLNIMRVPEAWNYQSTKDDYYPYNKDYSDLNIGKGVVVGTIDSGARVDHDGLKNNFRKFAGWRDGYNLSSTPVDLMGHGTHVVGTICGDKGIGVAPGAEWIACRGCLDEEEGCAYSALLFCCQWMLCPHDDPNSHEPESYRNCNTAPDLVSNSWGGLQGDHTFDRCAISLRAAGIIPVFANGNSGPECKTANSPGDSPLVIGVGATDSNDNLAWFSSRGPTVEGILKPDVSAPGVLVTSSWHNATNAFVSISGTSMACPHVSGLIALMLERCRLPYETILQVLKSTADKATLGVTDQICGGLKSDEFPNNFYGAGRVNALEAVKEVVRICEKEEPSSYSESPPPYQLPPPPPPPPMHPFPSNRYPPQPYNNNRKQQPYQNQYYPQTYGGYRGYTRTRSVSLPPIGNYYRHPRNPLPVSYPIPFYFPNYALPQF